MVSLRTLATFLISSGLALAAPPGDGKRTAVAPDYRLHPGDTLEIDVDSLPEMEKLYQIRSDGNINHPVAGDVSAAGKTVYEVRSILKNRFSQSLKKPGFRVGIYTTAQIEASAMGEVKSQGKFSFHSGSSMLDLLAQSGGASPKGDVAMAKLIRDEKQIEVDLSDTEAMNRFLLQDGDILIVPAGLRVSVTGEVREPGTFSVSKKSATPVDDVLKAAGGTKETAALNRVLLVRPELKKPIVVDCNIRDEMGLIKQKVEVRDGDIISVQPCRCVVVGGVDKQGQVVLSGNETLFDIVSAVGTSRGSLDQVVVIRAEDVEAGNDKRETYNLEESFQEGKSIPKVPIYDGDVVFVTPKGPEGGLWQSLGSFTSIIWMARGLFAI